MGRKVQSLEIMGPAGPLEARLDWPASPPRAAALVCHPHPSHGGNMHSKTVSRTARALVALGSVTLRFNFRGVGHSAGRFSGGDGELDDAACALETLVQHVPGQRLFLGGFSFGSHVALQLGSAPGASLPVAGLLAIAPPLSLFDFSFLEASPTPVLLAVGDADPFCPVAALQAFQARLGSRAVLEVLPDTGHLLLERLDELEAAIQRFATRLLSDESASPP